MTAPIPNAELALMLSGGDARGAYQVGVLRRIARECPAAVPGILTGVSSGGINAAYLAANQEPFAEKLENLSAVWEHLRMDDVFRVDLRALTGRRLAMGQPAARRRQASLAPGAEAALAVHLGARRILAVSTRYARSRDEADRPAIAGYPPPAQVAGVLYNAIFLDQLDSDALEMHRINRLIGKLPESQRDGLRQIDLLLLRPSVDLGRLANEYEPELPRAFRSSREAWEPGRRARTTC